MGAMTDIEQALGEAVRGAEEVIPLEELKAKLASGRELRIKLGMDPTAPDIHLGHTVILNKLRAFQALGHRVLLVIGDFTAQVGDPSGRNATRPQLSAEQIRANAQTYAEQAFRVLNRSRTEIVYNSSWLGELGTEGLLRLASKLTVARMLEREDFSRRYREGQPISIHEFLYPLLQGYDSVALRADVELGGTDQKFNLLMGRELQRDAGQEPQCVLMMPLLVGLDGVKKMSKSAGNYIGVQDGSADMFGKLMSLSDELMWDYFTLLSARPASELEALRGRCAAGELNPRDAKLELAGELVARYHGGEAAREAREGFINQFTRGALPEDMPEAELRADALATLLKQAGLCDSTSQARRLIAQHAVRLDGEVVDDPQLTPAAGSCVVQVGKRRYARLHIT